MNNSWTTTVLENPDNPDECVLEFPDDLIEQLSWAEGDILTWTVHEDGTVTISKKST